MDLDLNGILKLQHAYAVASKKLHTIGNQPRMVDGEYIGYFMSLENIVEIVKTLNPELWYENEASNDKPVTFFDLPEEDQEKLKNVLDNLQEKSMGDFELREKCKICERLSLEFCEKIMALTTKRRKITIGTVPE